MLLMLVAAIYCCSVHVFFPTFSLTVLGRGQLLVCTDHGIGLVCVNGLGKTSMIGFSCSVISSVTVLPLRL